MKNKLKVILKKNPLRFKESGLVYYSNPNKTLQDIAFFNSKFLKQATMILLNNKPILRKDWSRTTLNKRDVVTLMRVYKGGGGDNTGKNPAFTILSIVSVAFLGVGGLGTTIGLSETLAAVFTGVGAASALGMIVLGTSISTPSIKGKREDQNTNTPSINYSFSGQRNIARPGQVIPVIYGKIKIYPDLASASWYEYLNETSEQKVYQEFIIGCGNLAASYRLFGIKIGNIPVDKISNFDYSVRYETPISNNENNVIMDSNISNLQIKRYNNSSQGKAEQVADINNSNHYIDYGRLTYIDRLKFNFSCPSGVFILDSTGNVVVGKELYDKQELMIVNYGIEVIVQDSSGKEVNSEYKTGDFKAIFPLQHIFFPNLARSIVYDLQHHNFNAVGLLDGGIKFDKEDEIKVYSQLSRWLEDKDSTSGELRILIDKETPFSNYYNSDNPFNDIYLDLISQGYSDLPDNYRRGGLYYKVDLINYISLEDNDGKPHVAHLITVEGKADPLPFRQLTDAYKNDFNNDFKKRVDFTNNRLKGVNEGLNYKSGGFRNPLRFTFHFELPDKISRIPKDAKVRVKIKHLDYVNSLNKNTTKDIRLDSVAVLGARTHSYPEVTVLSTSFIPSKGFNPSQHEKLNCIVYRRNQTDLSDVAVDIITNKIYGLKEDFSRVKTLIHGRNFGNINCVFDKKTTAWEGLKSLCNVHAVVPLTLYNEIILVKDEVKKGTAAIPKLMFNENNISRFTLNVNIWQNPQTVHYVEVTFKNQDNDYNTETYYTYLPQGSLTGHQFVKTKPVGDYYKNPLKLSGFGVTDKRIVELRSLMVLSQPVYNNHTVKFDTDIQGKILLIGDLILVSYGFPKWGVAQTLYKVHFPSQLSSIFDLKDIVWELMYPIQYDTNQNIIVYFKSVNGSPSKLFNVNFISDKEFKITDEGTYSILDENKLKIEKKSGVEGEHSNIYYNGVQANTNCIFGIREKEVPKHYTVKNVSLKGNNEVSIEAVNYFKNMPDTN